MFNRIVRLGAGALDRTDYLITLARFRILDWLLGPFPETPTDKAIREEGERLRREFPDVYFDNTKRKH